MTHEYDEPRGDPRQRWRLYVLRDGGTRCLAAFPDISGLGLALKTLADEGQYDPMTEPVGLLDDVERRWLINPFAYQPRHV